MFSYQVCSRSSVIHPTLHPIPLHPLIDLVHLISYNLINSFAGEYVKLKLENIPKEYSETDAEALFSKYGTLRSGTRIFFDKRANKRTVEVEFMLQEDAMRAFCSLKNAPPMPDVAVFRMLSNGMGRQGEQELKRTLRIRAGGFPRGSANIVCKSDVMASDVATLLNGHDIGLAMVRARIGFKRPQEVMLDGLTEFEDEATLFAEFTKIGILPYLSDTGRCIFVNCTPSTQKSENDVSTWFQTKLRPYGEIQKLEVRLEKCYMNATVMFRSEAAAQAAKSDLHKRTDLFDSPTLPCEVTQIQPTSVYLLHEVAKRFEADILNLVNDFNSPTRTHLFEASVNGSNVYIRPIGNGRRSQLVMLSSTGDEIKDFLDSLVTYSSGLQAKLPASPVVFTAFSQGGGLQLIKRLQSKHNVVVKHQTVGNYCNIYGSAKNASSAEVELQQYVKSIESFVVDSVALSVSHYALLFRALSQDITKLRADNDKTTSLAYSRERSVLTVIGEQAYVDHIVKKVEAFRTQSVGGNLAAPPSQLQFTISGCVICGTSNVTESDRLRVCGHVICRQCLHNHFLTATVFPVKCQGGTEQRCTHAIPLYDAGRVLDEDERIEVSQHCVLDMMVRQRKMGVGRRYRACPTPGCPQLYVASRVKFNCDTCGQKYCLECARATGKDPLIVKDHQGESCDDYKHYNGGSSSTATSSTLSNSSYGLSFASNRTSNATINNYNNLLYSSARNIVPPPSSQISLADGSPLESYGTTFVFSFFILFNYLPSSSFLLIFLLVESIPTGAPLASYKGDPLDQLNPLAKFAQSIPFLSNLLTTMFKV